MYVCTRACLDMCFVIRVCLISNAVVFQAYYKYFLSPSFISWGFIQVHYLFEFLINCITLSV